MEVLCSYFGNGDFCGLQVIVNDEVAWNYNTREYTDFIVDCLNGDFSSIVNGHCRSASIARIDPAILTNSALNAVEKLAEKSQKSLEMSPWEKAWCSATRSEFNSNRSLAIADLAELNIDFYRKAVDTIFGKSDYPLLSAKQKYYAYQLANRSRSGVIDTYVASAKIEGVVRASESAVDSLETPAASFDDKLKRLDDNDKYSQICQLIFQSRETLTVNTGPVYTFHTLRETFVFLFQEMLTNNRQILKCPHCGRYFAATRKGEIYCAMPSPEVPAQNCREYVKYQKKLAQTHTVSAKLHKQIYNSLANRAKRADNYKLRAELADFMRESEEWRIAVENKTENDTAYIAWLNSIKGGVHRGSNP